MPVENELKFVLPRDFDPARLSAWRRYDIRQAYLDDGPRLRQIGQDYFFTYKRWIERSQERIEIETAISADDFNQLWPLCGEALLKTRYVKALGGSEWSIDFLVDAHGLAYFVMAEVEMPRRQPAPEVIPAEIRDHILYAVAAGDIRFTNKKLSSASHASDMYAIVSRKPSA